MLPAFVVSFWSKDFAYSLLMLSDGIQARNWERKKKEMKKLLNYCNVKLTPDNSNPCLLEPHTNLHQIKLQEFSQNILLFRRNAFWFKLLFRCCKSSDILSCTWGSGPIFYCEVHKKPTYQNAYIMICNSAGLSKQAFFAPTCRLYGNWNSFN